jgi:peptidyl-prolyl cis-trans isomerase SurA
MLSAMKVGDVTGVLRAQRGYQILKLESRTDSKVKTFDEARGDIGNKLGEQKLRGEREKYLDRLRAQATITWRNTELEKAYETALARRNQESGSKPQPSAAN